MLVIPQANVFGREVNAAISRGLKESKHVFLSDSLSSAVECWYFLDSWEGFARWRTERLGRLFYFLIRNCSRMEVE